MKAKDLLVACFVFFGLLLTWPLLAVANRPTLTIGIATLVVYLFGVWIAIAIVLVLVTRRLRGEEPS